jgi:hypothetical protein
MCFVMFVSSYPIRVLMLIINAQNAKEDPDRTQEGRLERGCTL